MLSVSRLSKLGRTSGRLTATPGAAENAEIFRGPACYGLKTDGDTSKRLSPLRRLEGCSVAVEEQGSVDALFLLLHAARRVSGLTGVFGAGAPHTGRWRGG
jgi:hypothetical protein